MAETVFRNIRLAHVHLFEPTSYKNGPLKYSASIVIPKDDTENVQVALDAIEAAKQAAVAKGDLTVKKVKGTPGPLRDGSIEFAEDKRGKEFDNTWFFNARNDVKSSTVDCYGRPITDPKEMYSGANYHVAVEFYYAKKGERIAASLKHVLKVSDNERWDDVIRTTPEEAFGDLIQTLDDSNSVF